MSDASSGRKLTPDQVVLVYGQSLTRAVIAHLAIMVAGAGLAVLLFVMLDPPWLKVTAAILAILVSGIVQRFLVLRVRCPACGERVLGHIHSIVQARNVTHCPACDARLRE
jgi:hypothetical protein